VFIISTCASGAQYLDVMAESQGRSYSEILTRSWNSINDGGRRSWDFIRRVPDPPKRQVGRHVSVGAFEALVALFALCSFSTVRTLDSSGELRAHLSPIYRLVGAIRANHTRKALPETASADLTNGTSVNETSSKS